MADGTVIRTAHRAKKSSAGYDLTRLLVGSEGTLGLITEITLRLQGIPEAISAARCSFPSVDAACRAAMMAIQYGLPIARMELLDADSVTAINNYSKLGLPEEPLLLLEFHGSEAGVSEQTEMFQAIAEDVGGSGYEVAASTEDRNRLWKARHDAYWAIQTLRPGTQALATDVCVPISRLAECVTASQEKLAELGLLGPISTMRSWWIWTTWRNGPRQMSLPGGWRIWRSRWTGRAPGSMGSGRGRCLTCNASWDLRRIICRWSKRHWIRIIS